MEDKEFKEEMKKSILKIGLVYYDEKEIKFHICQNRIGHSVVSIKFMLPHLSLENLRKFCLLNNFLLAYGERKMEINVGNTYHINEIKVPSKLINNKLTGKE